MSKEYKLRHYHVGKTGGGYLRDVFRSNQFKIHSSHNYSRPFDARVMKIILVIRDPIDRFISCVNWLYTRQKMHAKDSTINKYKIKTIEREALNNKYSDLNEIVSDIYSSWRTVSHVYNTCYYKMLHKDIECITSENLFCLLDFNNLTNDVVNKLKLKPPVKSRRSHVSEKLYHVEELSDNSLDILHDFYRKDYKIINRLQSLSEEQIINI
jgi:hypothetical protein